MVCGVVTKLTTIVIGCVLAAGCKDSAKKQPPPQSGSAQAGDPRWADTLPAVTGDAPKLLREFAIGLVKIDADGSLRVASAPSTGPADPTVSGADPFSAADKVQLGELREALGLPAVAASADSVFAPVDEAGSAAGSGSAAADNPLDVAYARLGHPVTAGGAPAPARRMTSAWSLVHANDVSGGVMVFTDAAAPANVLVDVIAQTGGFLAVRRDGKLGALPLALDRHAPAKTVPTRRWFELRLGATIELEQVPGTPVTIPSTDKIAEAVKAAGVQAVDVLVGGQTKVQDVVAVIEQLRSANVDAIGFGGVPGPDGGVRGNQGPRVVAWDFFVPDADKAATQTFRAGLDAAYEPMRTCYQAALAKKADLAGSVQLQITVAANGKVSGAEAKGLPALVACAVTAAKAATFPTPSTSAGTKLLATVAFASH